MLNLTDETVLAALPVTREFVVANDWAETQQLGAAGHRLGWQAILAPSATGVDQVLAVFSNSLGGGELSASFIETWERPGDLRVSARRPTRRIYLPPADA